jgi:hypothetical protein
MSEAFAHDLYSIQRQTSWLDPFGIAPAVYEISLIPPMSSERYSVSWSSGVLRREPDGLDLYSLDVSKGSLLARPSCEVRIALTREVVGRIQPVEDQWELRDAAERSTAHVLTIEEGYARARYVARVGEQDVCRFTWGFLGMTVHSAEMQIEFPAASRGRVDRALAIVAGIMLERHARWVSQLRNSR